MGRATDKSLLEDILMARQFVARMRRNLAPQRSVFYGLARPDFALIAYSKAQDAFKALERRFDRGFRRARARIGSGVTRKARSRFSLALRKDVNAIKRQCG